MNVRQSAVEEFSPVTVGVCKCVYMYLLPMLY